ncbi:MAG: hypothetical protein K2I30_00110 [Clostridia bacterium]|nr:hypothetical protein [Clostridia bacterium]
MRKRLVTTLLICLTAILAAFGFVACKNDESNIESTADVKGKTYVFADFSVSGEGDFAEFEAQCKEEFKGKIVTFGENGTISSDLIPEGAIYTQEGSKLEITVNGDKFDGEVIADTFLFYQNEGDAQITITFKLSGK